VTEEESNEGCSKREPKKESLIARLTPGLTALAAVIAAGLGIPTFFFALFPGCRSDPRERAEVTLRVLRLDEGVTQKEYLRRVERPLPTGCRDELKWLGVLAYVQGDVAGFTGEDASLEWDLYKGVNRYPFPRVKDPAVVRPRAPVNREIAQIWIPNPRAPGDYHVRFELKTGTVLRAITDSRVFTVPPVPPDFAAKSWCARP
jgi:hypothetical protein